MIQRVRKQKRKKHGRLIEDDETSRKTRDRNDVNLELEIIERDECGVLSSRLRASSFKIVCMISYSSAAGRCKKKTELTKHQASTEQQILIQHLDQCQDWL